MSFKFYKNFVEMQMGLEAKEAKLEEEKKRFEDLRKQNSTSSINSTTLDLLPTPTATSQLATKKRKGVHDESSEEPVMKRPSTRLSSREETVGETGTQEESADEVDEDEGDGVSNSQPATARTRDDVAMARQIIAKRIEKIIDDV